VSLTAKVGEAEPGCWQTRADGHRSFQRNVDVTANTAALSGKVLFVGIDIGPFVDLGNHQAALKLYTQLGVHYPLAYAVGSAPLHIYRVQGDANDGVPVASGCLVDQETGIVTEDQLRSIIQQKLLVGP
jgi:hypothetical protein